MSNALECVCQEINHLVLQGSLYRNKIWLFEDITLFGPTRSAIGKDMQPTISFLWNEDEGSCSLSLPLQRNHHHALIKLQHNFYQPQKQQILIPGRSMQWTGPRILIGWVSIGSLAWM